MADLNRLRARFNTQPEPFDNRADSSATQDPISEAPPAVPPQKHERKAAPEGERPYFDLESTDAPKCDDEGCRFNGRTHRGKHERTFSDRFQCDNGACKYARLYKVESPYKHKDPKWPFPAWKCPACALIYEQHCAEGLYKPYGFMSACSILCDL